MATVEKKITLTDQQDLWLRSLISAGQYADDSDVIRDLIRREQERSAQLETLRAALIEGENSGDPVAFESAAFKDRMRARHG
jgi:antitoxin ParD1/3/4